MFNDRSIYDEYLESLKWNYEPYKPVHYEPIKEYLENPSWSISATTGFIGGKKVKTNYNLPKSYIINQNACICFWYDGTKTVSKRHEDDIFDKELGFLLACWQHYNSNLSKNSRKRVLACIKQDCLKDFLLEKFRIETQMDTKKINGYLASLKVSNDKRTEKKIGKHFKEEE